MEFIEIIKAFFYGIVEGVTEWLPVSSTGHLILFEQLFPMDVSDEFGEMFRVVIQLGAIMAVIVAYFDKLNPFSRKKTEKQKTATWHLWFIVVVSVIPSAVIGLLFDDWFDAHFYNAPVVATMLIVYGIAFILIERSREGKAPSIKSPYAIPMKTALMIGAFQVLAIIPGTSRSGSTILGAMLLGLSRTAAAEFSFFMAIPTMLGASGLKAVKYMKDMADAGTSMTGTETTVLIIGCIVAFVVSLLAIKFLTDYVKRHTFSSFGIYRIALGLLVLVYFTASGLLFE